MSNVDNDAGLDLRLIKRIMTASNLDPTKADEVKRIMEENKEGVATAIIHYKEKGEDPADFPRERRARTPEHTPEHTTEHRTVGGGTRRKRRRIRSKRKRKSSKRRRRKSSKRRRTSKRRRRSSKRRRRSSRRRR